jgi:hypothetical protein
VSTTRLPEHLAPSDTFAPRHLGPSDPEVKAMLDALGYASLDALVADTVPEAIRLGRALDIGEPLGEHELLEELRNLAADKQVMRSFIGRPDAAHASAASCRGRDRRVVRRTGRVQLSALRSRKARRSPTSSRLMRRRLRR